MQAFCVAFSNVLKKCRKEPNRFHLFENGGIVLENDIYK